MLSSTVVRFSDYSIAAATKAATPAMVSCEELNVAPVPVKVVALAAAAPAVPVVAPAEAITAPVPATKVEEAL